MRHARPCRASRAPHLSPWDKATSLHHVRVISWRSPRATPGSGSAAISRGRPPDDTARPARSRKILSLGTVTRSHRYAPSATARRVAGSREAALLPRTENSCSCPRARDSSCHRRRRGSGCPKAAGSRRSRLVRTRPVLRAPRPTSSPWEKGREWWGA